MSKKKKLPLFLNQDSVKTDYLAVLRGDNKALGNLSRFFSPHCVPVGLTDEEISICVTLCSFREEAMNAQVARASEAFDKGDIYGISRNLRGIPLPVELISGTGRPMSRSRFKIGIMKYLTSISRVHIQRPANK